MKQRTSQVGEEIILTFFTTTSEQNGCTVLNETTVLCTLDLITFNGISTLLTAIHVDEAILQTSWQCIHSLHLLIAQSNKVDGW